MAEENERAKRAKEYQKQVERLGEIKRQRPLTVKDFWDLTGAGVESRLERMRWGSQGLYNWLGPNRPKESREGWAEINRAIIEALGVCRVLDSPPPDELIQLIAHQLKVEGTPRKEKADRKKKSEAAKYIALHPAASDREVGRQSGLPHQTIGRWRRDDEFRKWIDQWTEHFQIVERFKNEI
jgi:hypothetical protein